MAFLDQGHFLEHLGRARIAIMKILSEGQIDAIVILLGGDRQGKDLAFAQFLETFHASAPRTALKSTLSATTQDFQHVFMKFRRRCSPLAPAAGASVLP